MKLRTFRNLLPLGAVFAMTAGGCLLESEPEAIGEHPIINGTLVIPSSNVRKPYSPVVKINSCSAVKIGARKYMTAAHCTSRSRQFINITNSLDGDISSAPRYTITNAAIHPSYDLAKTTAAGTTDFSVYDIGIIEIAETNSIPYTDFVTDEQVRKNDVVRLIAYGCDTDDSSHNGKKQTGLFNVLEHSVTAWEAHYIRGDKSSGLDTCSGDSGGPIFIQESNSLGLQVVGVVSGGANFTRLENVAEWVNDPVENDFSNNSPGYFMSMHTPNGEVPSMRCISAAQGSGPVTLDVCDGRTGLFSGKSSSWRLKTSGSGFQIISRDSSAKCLKDVGNDAQVTAVNCSKNHTDGAQKWRFEAIPGQIAGTFNRAHRIVNVNTGRCMEITGSRFSGSIKSEACSNSTSQAWLFSR